MTAVRPMLVGNWKMHGDGRDLPIIQAIGAAARRHPAVDVALCLPATLLDRARVACPDLAIGGQDCHAQASGAHTGDISAPMLGEAGASLVLLGHSERRRDHGEDDALIAAKLRAARGAGLDVVLCVGETAEDHAAGRSAAVVRDQVIRSLGGAAGSGIAIAYEPIWAIGSDRVPDPSEVAAMAAVIRDAVSGVRVFYGGSVTPDNGAALFTEGGIDGFLVGRQSLEADAFTAILGLVAPSAGN
ncbi:triose-phosphate isomerase [Sphingomonas fuzhouensis]|uniref:triose-phosphate isomerase n=1 Tax=Sphingomonas fuzhouensis TaxID=3106033 RepID=UPI002B003DF5|nr:triose-phosphate isomerase [Sphingomonas sp. SGZ-02]